MSRKRIVKQKSRILISAHCNSFIVALFMLGLREGEKGHEVFNIVKNDGLGITKRGEKEREKEREG